MAGSDVRIVLLGKTGVGKSASANTILGSEEFVEESSPESVTRECSQFESKVSERKVLVVDTPGLFDTSLTNEQLKEEIVKCVNLTVPGPHAFLLVIRLGTRFTEEDRMTMKWIQENFSKLALKYALVLFSGEDAIGIPLEDYIEKSPALKQLISECGGGYHAFNNRKKDKAQVTRLLDKIDRMVVANGGQHYTDEMYLEAQRKIQEEEERKRMEEEMKRQEEERKRQEVQRKKDEAMRKEWERQEDRQSKEEERRRREEDKEYERKREEDRARSEEQERKRREEDKEEERKRREEDKKDKMEYERRREEGKMEYERKREEDKMEYERRREEDRARSEEQERKRREEDRQSRKEERMEWERRREEEKKEERKREEDRARSEEQERKRREEDRQSKEEERKRREEDKMANERKREEDRARSEEQERKRRELGLFGKLLMAPVNLVGGVVKAVDSTFDG